MKGRKKKASERARGRGRAGRKKEFSGMDMYCRGNLSFVKFAARTSLMAAGVILGQPAHLLLSLQSLGSLRSDPLISLHPLPPSTMSSCTKPSVIPSALETVTGRYSFRSLPGNSDRRAATLSLIQPDVIYRAAASFAARKKRTRSTGEYSGEAPTPLAPLRAYTRGI